MHKPECRACRRSVGRLILDLGEQPACDYFPVQDAPGPDPVYPLRMWLCSSCGLAQLLEDSPVPEEPKGIEPAALVAQAADAVGRVAAAGLLPAGATVAEYGSPHGGSWLGLLASRELIPVSGTAAADVVVDCFGLMHAADQATAIAERAARVAPDGILLLQYHSLATIVRNGQWNALRHGHYAYYSTSAITAMLAGIGFRPHAAWVFELYGGTVLLAARRAADGPGSAHAPTPETLGAQNTVRELLAAEERAGVRDPSVLSQLQRDMRARASALRDWLTSARLSGHAVLGYGAASRAVALLTVARVDRALLPAVADLSPMKQGRRMPGTGIPVIDPAELIARRPGAVLVLVSDLMAEVRAAYPEVEAAGGSWVDADNIPSPAGHPDVSGDAGI